MVDGYGKRALEASDRNECCGGCHQPVDACDCISASSDDLPTYEGRYVAGRWVPLQGMPAGSERKPSLRVSQ